MGPIERVREPEAVYRYVVTSGIPDPSAEVRRNRRHEGFWRKLPGLLDEPVFVLAQARVAIHAIELERHPMWTQIAFLEDKRAHSSKGREAARSDVVRPTVTKHQNVSDLMFPKEVIEEARPVSELASEVRRRLWPVDEISSADIDPIDLEATLAHRARKLVQ
jgi:hypothetical protein